tara:strand:+ start:1349 stop:3232 length:1884 start_codon:yes stop_codon:yes gene_type:complete
MPLQKFVFNPGINKEGTSYSEEGKWFDGNLVRFRKGLPEKVGGWTKYISASYTGTGRKLHEWVALDGSKYLSLGTRYKFYIQEGAAYNDVTPLRVTTSAGDVTFSATNGSSTVTVTDSSHGAVQGDFVTFSGAASLGGTVIAAALNQEYQIDLVTSTNAYTITAKDTSGDTVTANASDSGNGGGSVVGAYQINCGLDVYVGSTGWSSGSWGAGGFGSSTGLTDTNQLRLWSIDNFGEDLVINPRGGGIYYWDKTNGLTTRTVALTALSGANQAPTVGLQVIISDVDRHALVLGADPLSGGSRTGSIDPMLIAFSDQEDITEWESLATNTAGSLRCSAGSEIIGGLRARQETLIWTDVALYSLQYIGPPFTFGLNLVNEGVSLISPNGAINTPNGIFWMDKKGFYNYSGRIEPVPCSVHAYVFDDINEEQTFQFFAFLNKQFNEIGWFYCSGSSTSIDRYVTYNYIEQSWSIGQLARTAWLDEGVESSPRATGISDSVNYIYRHETGNDADGSPMTNVYIESADFDIGDGEQFQFIRKVIPDVKFTGGGGSDQTLNVVLKSRNYPGDSLSTDQTSSFTSSTTKIDTRARARQASIRFESDDDAESGAQLGVGFVLGATRLDLQPNGKR